MYIRKTTKDHAKKTSSEAGKTLPSFARGMLQKNGRILSKNERLEMITENGRFPAKTGALESLYICFLNSLNSGCLIVSYFFF